MKLSKSLRIIIAILLYVIAVGVRVYGLDEAPTQIDERHWTERADVVVKKFRAGDWKHLTTHLGHPGVPPGLIMASAQVIAEKINAPGRQTASFLTRLTPLYAARFADVVVSSLVIPILFLFLLPFLGAPIAGVSAALFALDPLHLSLSRQAHLDAFLTLFVVACLMLYLHALRRQSLYLKLCAGAVWGLAIATKPTAAPIVAILLLWRVIYRFYSGAENAKSTKLIEWSDCWAVLVGHIVFVAIYTRLWVHESDYLLRLAIHSRCADFLYFFGQQIHSTPVVLLLGLALSLATLRNMSNANRNCVTQLVLLSLTLVFLLALMPAVFENLARFWSWALGLSSMGHRAYGINWAPPPGGYVTIVLSRLPSLVLAGVAVSVIAMLLALIAPNSSSRLEISVVLSLFLGFVLWLIPLSISSKQTIRYAMPMVPALYVCSAWGFWTIIKRFSSQVARFGSNRTILLYCCVPVLAQALITAKQYPDYVLFYSSLSGGLSGAMARGQSVAVAGEEGAIRKLEEDARREERDRMVMVLGDFALIRYLHVRLYPEGKRYVKLIAFEKGSLQADYLMVFPNFIGKLDLEVSPSFLGEKVYSYVVDGVDVLPVFKLPVPECSSPCIFPLHKSVIGTGGLRWAASHINRNVDLNPAVHQAGDVVRGFGVRVHAGRHEALFDVKLDASADVGEPDDIVANLSFSSKCEHALMRKELSSAEVRTISLPCEFTKGFTPQIRFYWRGTVPVTLSRVALKND